MDTLRTARTALNRRPDRGSHEREVVYAILDAGFVCHIGFVADGQPFVMPTGYVRAGDRIYLHGSAAGRMIQTLGSGVDVCLTVTLVDGIVLARSAPKHSINFRSVVVLGRARPVTDAGEKMDALRRFTNHVAAGRFEEVRRPSEQDLKGTGVLALPIDEASAKIRTGPPADDEQDMALDVWAGVVPVSSTAGTPVAAPGVPPQRRFDVSRLLISR